MANRKASVWTYKKVDGSWRYCKPLVGKNNKIKPEPGVVYYVGWYRKNLVAKITRVDLLRYRAWLIDKKLSPRTSANKMLRVNQYLRHVLGLPEGKGPVTVKDAKFTELEPTVYSDEELIEFFKH